LKKLDLGQTISILANLGVIAGILFLGIELRQNNTLMESQARFNRLSVITEGYGPWAENGELAELRVRASNGEELSEVERRRIEGAIMQILLRLEWVFHELPGRLARTGK